MKTFDGYKKQALTDVYALLAGGGHKLISDFATNNHTHSNYVTLTTTLTIEGSKTFTTGIRFNTNKNGDANLGSNDGFKLFYNETSGRNFPGNYYNVASFITGYTGFLLACYGGADLALKYRHREDNGTWHPWKTLAFTTDIPSSLKNPYALTLKANGTTLATYDGSSAKEANFTYANVGAASASHTHDDRYVRAFGTSNDNIDSDWGLSFKTFDPIPSGTPPEKNPNISILNIGNSFNRRKLLAFIYSNDNIYYRRHVDNSFTNWRRLAFANEIPTSLPANGGNADTIDGYHANGLFTAFGNNAHNITATIGGVTKSFLVNWAADSDKLDGYHENSFLRYRETTSIDLENTLWDLIGIKLYNDALPDNLTNVYNYGSVISLPCTSTRFEIYASELASLGNGLYYRSGWRDTKRPWLKFIDSSNIGSQSVNYANSAGNADKLDGIHASGLLTALSNSNNGISVTVGGTTKSVSNISVNYANSAGSAGSATKVIVNLHTANDTNYPLVWSNLSNSSTITENQLYKSWSDLYYNPKNKRLTVGGSVVASSFIKSGGTSLQLLRADGGIATFNWSGQSGLPTWLWGGNNLHSYYVYNPSNFRVAYSTSAGNADTLDGEHAKDFVRAGFYENNNLNSLDTYSFIRSVNSQVSSTSPKGDIGWYNVILLVHRNGDGDGPNYIGLIALGMTSNVNDIFFRCRRTDPWKTIIHSNNYTEFINNYYWANVKISTTSSTTTSPTVSNLTATSSIRMGNIYLLNTNEINSASGIHLNYQNSGNISLCAGGGNVGIGTISPSYKLDVNGNIHSSGTINCNALNVGSTLSIKDSAISCSASDISIESKESGYLLIDSRQVLRYDLNSIDISNKTSFGNRLGLGASSPDPISNISTTDDVTVYIGSLIESSFFEFRPAMDGLLLFLKIGKLHSKTYFWCTARNCEVIKADNFSTYLARNQNKDCFGDGCARIFIYKLITEKWYEFYCG